MTSSSASNKNTSSGEAGNKKTASGSGGSTATKPSTPKAEENLSKKIVIRRLPPSLTKEQFLDIVSPLPEYDFFYYCDADTSLDPNAYCRAYICFPNFQDVLNFKDRFDGYVFVDAKSNEYPAVIELAPFQRRYNQKELDEQQRQKPEAKCNTIEQDADYQKYLESFETNGGGVELPTCESILEELEQKEKERMAMGLSGKEAAFTAPKIVTPLLEYMKRKKEEKRAAASYSIKERDRDHRSNRRRDRDRDRDDEKQRHSNMTGPSGGGIKKRGGGGDDHYYHGPKSMASNESKHSSSAKSQSGSSSSKASAGGESLQKGHNYHQSQQKQSNNKGNQSVSKSSSTTSASAASGVKKLNQASLASSVSSASSVAAATSSGDAAGAANDDQRTAAKASPAAQRDQQRDKVKNKDRPSIAIYNPAERAAKRQQQSKPQNF